MSPEEAIHDSEMEVKLHSPSPRRISIDNPIPWSPPSQKPPTQVGGSHYEQAIEPIEYIEANNLDFHEGNVVKYVSRWKRKNGLEDLKKAQWYLNRLIEITQHKD